MTKQEAITRLHNLQSIEEFDLCTFIDTWYKGIKDDYDEALKMAIEALSAQPEIIRCKDCKWHLTYHDEKYNVGYELCSNPAMMSGDSMIDMSNNDFCSKAERKDNG